VPEMFHPESELRQNYVWYENSVGATMTAEVLLSFDDPTETSDDDAIDQLRQVMRVQRALTDLPEVGGALSAINFLPLPTRSRSVSASITRSLIRAQLADETSQTRTLGYVDRGENETTWRISLRMFQTRGHRAADTIQTIRRTAETAQLDAPRGESTGQDADNPADVLPASQVTLTGHLLIVDGSQQLLLNDLFTSFLTAFGVIAVLMAIHLRSVVGGILAMLPNLIPTLILFGSMGWLQWPLDIGSVMTASVALGIAVDDSVHLLSQYRLGRQSTADRRAAATIALRHCGWAMLQTTIVCSLSLMVYGLSPFVPTQRFAFFMLGLLAIAWIGVSTLLPAIMATRAGDFFVKSSPPI